MKATLLLHSSGDAVVHQSH